MPHAVWPWWLEPRASSGTVDCIVVWGEAATQDQPFCDSIDRAHRAIFNKISGLGVGSVSRVDHAVGGLWPHAE
ncbi:uncharacterized protein N7482_008015 [Penicillium canariense]|uniref:Uncharacterized protein n=1 Tax=Penicillium canariense TaxID=189055 RepID=A0A9W9HVF9_9EURO|nr:uncharacterized protein N7482_008015 [Penicillium canariense]KAJ5156915.1 hypothetical protein N7482_008015 [Penicillium canariense]